ncbi:MAG: DUF2061 domain-containing protein [Candidatus Aenigmatarchaeota archaeon]
MIETRKRSLVKTVVWRIICIIASIIVPYFLTGSLEISIKIGIVYNVIVMVLYYFHERIWDRTSWGRVKT